VIVVPLCIKQEQGHLFVFFADSVTKIIKDKEKQKTYLIFILVLYFLKITPFSYT